MILVGDAAPDFTVKGVYQGKVCEYFLQAYRGKWLVLFFYPADFTFICPTEVTGFSKAEKEIFDKELHEAEVLADKEPYLVAEG